MSRVLVLTLLLTFALCDAIPAQSPLKVVDLRCENISNPINIDIRRPRFSWKFSSSEKNKKQSAYEIVVAERFVGNETGGSDALANPAPVWKSGKIVSDTNVNIPYAGSALKPFTRYYWNVVAYDEDGAASSSEIAFFETAMLEADDWQAKWIGDGRENPAHDSLYFRDDPMPLLRKTFDARKGIKKARLYIAGLGYHEAFVNGKKVLQSKAVDGLFHWDIGDHEALDPRADALSASSFYYHHAKLAARFAGILGHDSDSVKFARLSENIKNAIVRKYHIPNTGRFDNATQAAQIFALWYGFTPERELSLKVLRDEFARHNGHLSTGIFSTRMMFDLMRSENLNDIAYALATADGLTGWKHMLDNGATTLWETWKYPEKYPSQNHPMFGSISEWFFRSLLGINAGAPGFKHIILKPQPAGDLTWARGSYNSVQGLIKSDWNIGEGSFSWTISIPANSTADVYIPSSEKASVVIDGAKAEDLKFEHGYAIARLGSGNYSIVSDYDKR